MHRWKWLALGFALAYWGALFAGTHLPSGGRIPGHGFDKLLHAGAYCGLAIVLASAWASIGVLDLKARLMILFIASAYGAVDELTQSFVPGRSPDIVDWAADTLGAMGGIAICTLLFRRSLPGVDPPQANASR